VMLMASANPEDYTNRGRIITPLKDRFGSQIRTHYPLDVQTEVDIMRQEAVALDIVTAAGAVKVIVPDYLTEVVATFSHLARASNQVNQRSGVSVRLSVSNYEALAANALRRGLRSGERTIVARVDDLDALAASSMGKIEIESLDEGRDGAIMEHLIKGAVLTVFKEVVPPEHTRAVVDAFEEGAVAHTGEGVTSEELARLVEEVDALRAPVAALTGGDESPAAVGAAIEFVLEGLHLSKRLNKDSSGASATYRGRT
jgi:magnesium chelatase subunit I